MEWQTARAQLRAGRGWKTPVKVQTGDRRIKEWLRMAWLEQV
jgi:hypothetical protein